MDRIAPAAPSELCDAVREAARAGATLEIVSHGTKRALGRPLQAATRLDVSLLSGIVKYEPEELVIVVRAATPMAEIEAALAERNQMLGFEPADWGPLFGAPSGEATIAGVAAANACGSRRMKAGAVRDHVIGVSFINGLGEAVKAGGPVIKNVTGFDVSRLMCGAFGTLGILTELTLRVVPRPPQIGALVASCHAKDGLRILREAARLPLDPTGLAYVPTGNAQDGGRAVIRVEGTNEAVADKLAMLKKRFAEHETRIVDADSTNAIFLDLSDGQPFIDSDADIWRLCVPPAAATAALSESGGQSARWYADWAGGLIWLGLPADVEVAQRLRGITAKHGGHAMLMRAPEEARAALHVFEPESEARTALTRSVKAAFDPNAVFNRGRMYKDI